MLRLHCYKHIFKLIDLRRIRGRKLMFIEFFCRACFGLAIFETSKKVPVSSQKIEFAGSSGFITLTSL